MLEHEGATLRSKKAYVYQDENKAEAIGDVFINQGDTITQSSSYVNYDANTKKAKSWGNVELKDPTMTLTTDTLHFDREKQMIYYYHHGKIKDSINTLKSKVGKYYLSENKFQATTNVEVVNKDNKLTSNHLDYYTNTGIAEIFGESIIKGDESTIYTSRGIYNSTTGISHLLNSSEIIYKDRNIKGDSIYYNKNKNYASITNNITVTDTINNSILKGNYAEYYQLKDSVYITDKAYAISIIEKDSMFIHGDKLMVTGKPDKRIIRAFSHVKFFKSDLKGKCDSLNFNQELGITKMLRRPVLWTEDNQITGDTIHLISNPETEKLDSLKVINNAFMIKQDSAGYSQTKGKNILGKFIKNDLKNVLVNGNGEVINYMRNDKNELVGILKMRCSNILLELNDKKIESIQFKTKPEGKTYPLSQLDESERLLEGFIWRVNERPNNKNDIFKQDEGDDVLIQELRLKEKEAAKLRAIEIEKILEEKLLRDSLKIKDSINQAIDSLGLKKIDIKKSKSQK